MTKQRTRFETFNDEEWARIEPLLPTNVGRKGHPFGDSGRVVEGIVYRYRELMRERTGGIRIVRSGRIVAGSLPFGSA